MEQFNSIFEFLPTWHITVCKVHHQGILKSQLRTHLQNCHKELTVKTRRDIVLAAAAFRGWAEDEKAIADVWPEIRPRARHPIPHLRVYKNGFKCTADHCGIVTPYIRDIQQHCQEDHQWRNSRKRGRPGKGQQAEANCMWTEGVWYQKFHKTGNLGTPFEAIPPDEDMQDPADEDHDIQRAVELSLSQATLGLEEAGKKKRAQIEADNNRYEFNKWLSRAGWKRHLKGLNREWLLTLIRRPDTDEEALEHIVYAVRMIIWSAKQVSESGTVGLAALNYINRREFGNNTNEKPFNTSQMGKTMDKYSHWWVEIIAYIWRSRLLPEVVQKEGAPDVEGKRPPYQLTDRQDKLLRKIEAIVGRDQDEWERAFEADIDNRHQLTPEEETKLQELVLQFILALLDQVLGDNEYHSALISGMAVLGIDARCSWVSPLIYTPKQAAVVNISRMLVLYQATRLRKKQVDKLKRKGLGQKKAESKARSHFHHVKKMANRFMTLTGYGGEPTPIDSIQRLKAYGMKIRYTTSAEGVIDWVDDTLLYGNIRFSMPQLRSMVHGMVASSRQHLLKELMLLQVDNEGKVIDNTTALPAIHWDQLVDNPAERKTDWSFMEDERNQAAIGTQDPKGWLGRRVIHEAQLTNGFIDITATRAAMAAGQAAAVWNKDRVEVYRRAMKAFRRDLLALVHMTGGLPARGTELVTVQYKNSPDGDSRGIFIENGLVVYVTTYHKGAGSSGKGKVIHRYLPREVGELMVYYLWFALPFWQKIESALSGEPIDTSAYIWKPEPEKAWLMPQKRQRADEEGSSRRVGESDEEEHNDEEEVVDDEPASAVELWNSNRVKYAIQKASLQYMGVKLNIMAWRHSTKAIYRKYIDSQSAVKAFVQGDEDESNDEDEAFDIQTGHGSSIGGMIYGRSITEATFSTESKRAALRRVSMEWHTFLQVPSALETKPRRGTRAAARRQEATNEEFRRWKMMRHVDVDKALRQLVGEQAEFRSKQRPALEAIMWQKSPVVAIMGTGAGKSILFMLPAFVSSGVSVVITPLISLRENMHDRCNKLGITCVEWDSRRPHEWAQIVLVAPESAVGEGFGNFMNRQRAMGRLDRVVVDECHVVLDSLGGWRTRMLALRNLVTVETQMVYLTATLRPSEEELFIQLMGLPPKAQCQWFRGATTRPNIQYRIHPYDTDEEEEAIKALVEECKKKYPLPGQVIVYCDTIDQTKRLAEVLHCVCYYREVGSSREKRELVMQLTSGQQQVFTATNALGLGVDAPTIRVVIHIGIIRLMRHYAQESGRAGRDGLPSEAIIMRGFKTTRKGPIPTKFSKDVEPEMKEFISGDGCMRKILDEAMDGRKNRTNCEEGEEKCQRCRAFVDGIGMMEEEVPATPPVQVQEEADRAEFEQQLFMRKIQAVNEAHGQAKDAIQVENLVGLMDEWKVGCQRCRAWNIRANSHDIQTCWREGAEETRQGVEEFNKMKKWAYCSCCYECGLPQSICESFEVNIVNGGHQKQQGVACQYTQVLVETVMAIWVRHPQEFGDFVEETMRRDGWVEKTAQERENGPGIEEIAKWFCKKKRWGGIESNKMSWFVCELVDRFSI